MKKRLTFVFLSCIISVPCNAQWKTAGFNAQILAFGVHDTTLFESDAGAVGRFIPTAAPDAHWAESDNGMGFGNGNVMWFTSLGRYFYANEGQGVLLATYRTSDNGSHWEESPSGDGIGSNGYYLFGKYMHYSIGPYMALSRDSGQTWDSVANFIANTIVTNGTYIFASTGNAIWRSTDTGNHWSQLSPPFVGAMTMMGSLFLSQAAAVS